MTTPPTSQLSALYELPRWEGMDSAQREAVTAFCERLSDEDAELQLLRWNQTQHHFADDVCLHDLLSQQAKRTPDATAVVCGSRVLSYRELDEASDSIARNLVQCGVNDGEPVGLWADQSADAIIGLVGILKAGAAYLPLDASFPTERLEFFLRQSEARFVVGPAETRLGGGNVRLLVDEQLQDPTSVDLPKVDPSSLAYVLFTSGSTGKAKGVMLNHRGPVNTIRDVNLRLGADATDRTLALSALGFDLSVYDVFGMLAVGGAVVQPTKDQARDPAAWPELIRQHRVSIWNTVPALMDMLATYLSDGTALPTLRSVLLSGDWIPLALPERIHCIAPAADLYSLGGSTEASIWSVMYPIQRVDPAWKSVPYGHPMRNQACYIIDEEQRLCPVGEVGELCLAGVGVAQGYLNRSELTKERFIADPIQPGSTLYRTGDLCRYVDEHGTLEFLGRSDQQVKIRGYRIGLGEIKSAVDSHNSVRDAAVLVQEDELGPRLVAYVVEADGNPGLSLGELNAFLSRELPSHMLPSALVVLARLPLNDNGKVDRRALPEPPCPVDASHTGDDLGDARSVAGRVAEILSDLLGGRLVHSDDDFFALGGNSLAAIALTSRIKQAFGVELSYPGILTSAASPRELARQVEAQLAEAKSKSKVTDAQRCDLSSAPLSFQQQQMWVVDQLERGHAKYNVPLAYRVTGSFSPESLRRAVEQLVERHHILRTVYRAEDTQLQQTVLPDAKFDYEFVDLRQVTEGRRRAACELAAVQVASEVMDLSCQPPLRIAIFQLDDNEFYIVLVIHHIAVDGHSIDLIHQELQSLYAANQAGQVDTLPQLPYQYANFAAEQKERPLRSASREYWAEKLAGEIAPTTLPRDEIPIVNACGDVATHRIDGELLLAARQYAAQNRTTLFVVLLTAIKALLYRYTQQSDITIGSAISARDDFEYEELVGYFINVLPLRTTVEGEVSFAELIGKVRETALEALEHSDFPLEVINRELIQSACSGDGPFRLMFILEPESCELSLAGATVESCALHNKTAKFDLLISASESDERVELALEYREDLFARERIEQFGRHLSRLLQGALSDSSEPIARLPIERSGAVLIGRSTAEEFVPIHKQFELQASKTPEAVAVQFGDESLTYRELDRRADELANRLAASGVSAGDAVGIDVRRSPEMISGLIAILKAGAAYVPIDAALPVARQTQILQEAKLEFVLTEQEASDQDGVKRISVAKTRAGGKPPPTGESYASQPEDLAYVLFTSGSTGTPKGVAMGHGALSNLIQWQSAGSVANVGTKTLQFASLGFDVSFQEIFATLCTGGDLQLVDTDVQRDLNQVWKTILQRRVERIFVPFVVLRGLCEIAVGSGERCELREVITAGEKLEVTSVVREFFVRHPECQLWNHYGPTETHVVTAHRLVGPAHDWPKSPPIGKPIDNCSVWVLDSSLRVQPPGIPGELYIGGAGLAHGYYHRDDFTEQRFVDVQLDGATQRLYRTGDVCSLNFQGELLFHGRSDNQTKIRGHRVEVGEIEQTLAQLPCVRQAIVQIFAPDAEQGISAGDKARRGNELVACVLADGGSHSECEAAIREELASRLPSYMIPHRFVFVDTLPTSVNGKVDRRRVAELVAGEQSQSKTDAETYEPHDALTMEMLEIWKEVLGRNQIDAGSNFFDCGGDSLSAAILFSRLEQRFDTTVSITQLVASPTVASLARFYRDKQSAQWKPAITLHSGGEGAALYCLPGIDGHLLNFRSLAETIGTRRPVIGLQPFGIDGKSPLKHSIEEMAASYVAEIREQQSDGPYNVLGFSFGGAVAYEVAQLLREAGSQVYLSLVDASPHMPRRSPPVQNLVFHLRFLLASRGAKRWKYLRERVNALRFGAAYSLGLITMEQRLQGIIDVNADYARVAVENMQALDRYRPAPSRGPATLYRASFRADRPGRDQSDPQAGWGDLFQEHELEVIEVPGAHADILAAENISMLCECLQQRMLQHQASCSAHLAKYP